MAETVRGGLYLGEDGRWHDAEGRVVEGVRGEGRGAEPGQVVEGARGEGRGAEPGQVDGMDTVDVVDGEPAPAPSTKKRGK